MQTKCYTEKFHLQMKVKKIKRTKNMNFGKNKIVINLIILIMMQNARLDEAQAGIKIARRNIKNLRHTGNTTLVAESEDELQSLLMKMKEKSEKAGLKLNIQRTKIMTSGPMTSWQIDGETMETVRDFIIIIIFVPTSLQMVTASMKLKDTCSLEEKLCLT